MRPNSPIITTSVSSSSVLPAAAPGVEARSARSVPDGRVEERHPVEEPAARRVDVRVIVPASDRELDEARALVRGEELLRDEGGASELRRAVAGVVGRRVAEDRVDRGAVGERLGLRVEVGHVGRDVAVRGARGAVGVERLEERVALGEAGPAFARLHAREAGRRDRRHDERGIARRHVARADHRARAEADEAGQDVAGLALRLGSRARRRSRCAARRRRGRRSGCATSAPTSARGRARPPTRGRTARRRACRGERRCSA